MVQGQIYHQSMTPPQPCQAPLPPTSCPNVLFQGAFLPPASPPTTLDSDTGHLTLGKPLITSTYFLSA